MRRVVHAVVVSIAATQAAAAAAHAHATAAADVGGAQVAAWSSITLSCSTPRTNRTVELCANIIAANTTWSRGAWMHRCPDNAVRMPKSESSAGSLNSETPGLCHRAWWAAHQISFRRKPGQTEPWFVWRLRPVCSFTELLSQPTSPRHQRYVAVETQAQVKP